MGVLLKSYWIRVVHFQLYKAIKKKEEEGEEEIYTVIQTIKKKKKKKEEGRLPLFLLFLSFTYLAVPV